MRKNKRLWLLMVEDFEIYKSPAFGRGYRGIGILLLEEARMLYESIACGSSKASLLMMEQWGAGHLSVTESMKIISTELLFMGMTL